MTFRGVQTGARGVGLYTLHMNQSLDEEYSVKTTVGEVAALCRKGNSRGMLTAEGSLSTTLSGAGEVSPSSMKGVNAEYQNSV